MSLLKDIYKDLDWYIIDRPINQTKSIGYRGKFCQDKAKKIREEKNNDITIKSNHSSKM